MSNCRIPLDIWSKCLAWLDDTHDLAVCAKVCKSWSEIIFAHSTWAEVVRNRKKIDSKLERQICELESPGQSKATISCGECTCTNNPHISRHSGIAHKFTQNIMPSQPSLGKIPTSWKRLMIGKYLAQRNWLQGRCRVETLRPSANYTLSTDDIVENIERSASILDGVTITISDTLSHAVSVTQENSIIWSPGTQRPLQRPIPSNSHRRVSAIWAAGCIGSVITGGKEGILSVWEYSPGIKRWVLLARLEGHLDEVECIQSDDEWVLSGSSDHSIKVWSRKNWSCHSTLVGHSKPVTCLQFNKNILVSGSCDATIRIWRMPNNTDNHSPMHSSRCIKELKGHTGDIYCLQFDRDFLVSGSADCTAKVWSLGTGQCIRTLSSHTGGVTCLHLTENKLVTGSADQTVKVWSFPDGKLLNSFAHTTHTNDIGPIWKVKCNEDKIMAAGGLNNQCCIIWDFDGWFNVSTEQKKAWGVFEEVNIP